MLLQQLYIPMENSMTSSLVEIHKAKLDKQATYIELDTTPNIVQSMVSIERSMQNAVDRLRGIKQKSNVKEQTSRI